MTPKERMNYAAETARRHPDLRVDVPHGDITFSCVRPAGYSSRARLCGNARITTLEVERLLSQPAKEKQA